MWSCSFRSHRLKRVIQKLFLKSLNELPKRVPVFWRSIATALPVALFSNNRLCVKRSGRDFPRPNATILNGCSQKLCAVGLRFWRSTSNPSPKRKNRHPKGCLFFGTRVYNGFGFYGSYHTYFTEIYTVSQSAHSIFINLLCMM